MQVLRSFDQQPDEDLLGQVAGAVHRADDRIAEPSTRTPPSTARASRRPPSCSSTAPASASATSATAARTSTAAARCGAADPRRHLRPVAHRRGPHHRGAVADQRHRNLILKALDGVRDEEPDLFEFPAEVGDRVFVCSDGACGTLDDARMAYILGTGTPDFAAVELVCASLEAGSTECHLHRRRRRRGGAVRRPPAAARRRRGLLPRRMPLAGAVGGLFRGHRSGDTGEIPPVPSARRRGVRGRPDRPRRCAYAPRAPGRYFRPRRLLIAAVLLGLTWIVLAAGWSWSQQQFYVGEQDGNVVIFRGIDQELRLFRPPTPPR